MLLLVLAYFAMCYILCLRACFVCLLVCFGVLPIYACPNPNPEHFGYVLMPFLTIDTNDKLIFLGNFYRKYVIFRSKSGVFRVYFFYFLLFFLKKKIEISGARRPIDLYSFYLHI